MNPVEALTILRELRPFESSQKLRLGNLFDGGYVLSKQSLDSTKMLFTLGVNNEWSFEKEYVQMTGNRVLMIDDHFDAWSNFKNIFVSIGVLVNLRRFKEKLAIIDRYLELNIDYIKMQIACRFRCSYKKHFVTKNNNDGISLTDLWDKYRVNTQENGVLLKVDIEGSEYDIVDDIIKLERSIGGLIIEFHDVLKFPERFRASLNKLKQKFYLEHVHFNNFGGYSDGLGDVIELSFIHKSLVEVSPKLSKDVFPISDLDFANDKENSDYPISFDRKDH